MSNLHVVAKLYERAVRLKDDLQRKNNIGYMELPSLGANIYNMSSFLQLLALPRLPSKVSTLGCNSSRTVYSLRLPAWSLGMQRSWIGLSGSSKTDTSTPAVVPPLDIYESYLRGLLGNSSSYNLKSHNKVVPEPSTALSSPPRVIGKQ